MPVFKTRHFDPLMKSKNNNLEVQSSTHLVNWIQVPVGTGDNTVAVTAGTSVVYDVPAGGKSFVRLVVKN